MKNFITIISVLVFGCVSGQNIVFADANLKAKLLTSDGFNGVAYTGWDVNNNTWWISHLKIDQNNDNEISYQEASAVTALRLRQSYISNLSDLVHFTNLRFLDCSDNDVSNINLNIFQPLYYLNCSNNNISSLDLAQCSSLAYLLFDDNNFSNPDFSNNQSLKTIFCNRNNIATLNLDGLNDLQYLSCAGNLLTSIDLSNNPSFIGLGCEYNNLVNINIKNGTDGTFFTDDFWSNNPNLSFICADDSELNTISFILSNVYPNRNININSFCTFTPGGTSYAIKGTNHYDQNNNGCDNSDISFLNLKLNLSDGTNSGSVFANNAVNYNILVNAGTYTITPQLENQNYFNVTPNTTSVTFPASASPFNQDYCVTANGVHNDLEINLLPISTVKPGFQTTYYLVYKNKGTSQQSGTISFNYDDSKFTYVDSDLALLSQNSNLLNWNFSNLQPFETRYFGLRFSASSSTNSIGDLINTSATIVGTIDETPTDNTSSLVQTVTNSYDPNDKTCLEGETIATTKVGDYVHYMIRFENNGTANATNIIVEDVIDTTKFDINSLTLIKASHGFVTKINNSKNVAFVFENINLPFSNINNANDGYVAFKIKTKSTLVAGNSFSNKASIFFDYNAPIVTNSATTTVVNSLKNSEFVTDNNFKIAPNPAKNTLTIISDKITTISSISIYNRIGQLVQTNTGSSKNLDVSQLKSGHYFMKIVHNGGVSCERFIKE